MTFSLKRCGVVPASLEWKPSGQLILFVAKITSLQYEDTVYKKFLVSCDMICVCTRSVLHYIVLETVLAVRLDLRCMTNTNESVRNQYESVHSLILFIHRNYM